MAWDPSVPNRVYEGNDGGAYVSTTNGDQATGCGTPAGCTPPTTSRTTIEQTGCHGTSEPWTQSYHFSISQTVRTEW